MKHTNEHRREIRVAGDVVSVFLHRRSNLFAVTLREVDNEAADGRQRDHRTSTGMP